MLSERERAGPIRKSRRVLGALAMLLGACGSGEELASTNLGMLRLATVTEGEPADPDGYSLSIDDGPAVAIGVADTVESPNLPPGDHSVALVGMAVNCRLAGSNPRSVTVLVGTTTELTFRVTCTSEPPAGTLQLTISTTGALADPDGYQVFLDSAPPQPVGLNDSITIAEVAAGPHTIRLGGVVEACTIAGRVVRAAAVLSGEVTRVGYDIACLPPPTGRIAFGRAFGFSGGGLFVINADGTDVGLIANNGGAPSWSPDGSKLAFMQEFSTLAIWEAGQITPIASLDDCGLPNTMVGSIAWSPDGNTWLCLVGGRLFTLSVDGAERTQITPDSLTVWSAAWSPDGEQVVFHHAADPIEDTEGLSAVNADGSGLHSLLHFPPEPKIGHVQSSLSWSPDGSRIVWHRLFDAIFSQRNRIYVLNADGTGLFDLTNGTEYTMSGPVWSPDGSLIAFGSIPCCSDLPTDVASVQVYTIRPDGSRRTNVTNFPDPRSIHEDPFAVSAIDWSPDGSRLVFGAGRADFFEGGTSDLVTVGSDGTHFTRLTALGLEFPEVNSGSPSWGP